MEYNYSIPDEVDRFGQMGGGDGYDPTTYLQPDWPTGPQITSNDSDYTVTSAKAFKNTVMDANDGEVVWVPGDTTLDVTGIENVVVENQITIASDRGINGSSGALLKTSQSPDPFLNLRAQGIRVTGLQFLGPITTHEEYSWKKEGNAINATKDDIEVDNCIFRGWGYAGVQVGREGAVKVHVHHNQFVDNPMAELGYGVTIWHGETLIVENYFDDNRHAVSCTGLKDASYVARNNFCGPHTIIQTFDMHRANEVNDNAGDQAGKSFEIIGNVIMADTDLQGHKTTGIYIRGNPLEKSIIAENEFAHDAHEGSSHETNVGETGDAYALGVKSLSSSNIVVGENYYNISSPSPIPDY